MQVNAAMRPFPDICAHSIPVPWQWIHTARDGTKRLPHDPHREPISFS